MCVHIHDIEAQLAASSDALLWKMMAVLLSPLKSQDVVPANDNNATELSYSDVVLPRFGEQLYLDHEH